jgi:hypothetical protein
VDLFGEHSVQVTVAATQALLEAALVLTLAALLVLLAVRLVQRSAAGPVLASLPAGTSRAVPPSRDADVPSARWLNSSLPTRAPPPCDPGSLPGSRRDRQRFRPSPTGVSSPPDDGLRGAQTLRA